MEEDTGLGRTGERPSWIRSGSVFVRAVHLLAASAVLGAGLWEIPGPRTCPWWIAAAASGLLLLAAEALRHRELHREVCGLATALKLVLLGGAAALPAGAPWLLSAAFVVAVLGAHFPKRWRHRKLL
jgi:hypothetical protein